MKRTQIVNSDGTQVEVATLQRHADNLQALYSEKDESVTAIREALDSAERQHINKKALKEALKWVKKGKAEYEAHATDVALYLSVLAGVQLDVFEKAATREPGSVEKAEALMDGPEHEDAGDREMAKPAEEEGPENPLRDGRQGDDTGTFKPIGEAVNTVVETVGEMVKQNELEKEVEKAETGFNGTGDPETTVIELRAQARLEGERDGRNGVPRENNPYPNAKNPVMHEAWEKGWAEGVQNVKPARGGKNGAAKKDAAKGGSVPPTGKFVDKTPRMSASSAAAILSGGGTKH